MNTPTEPVLVVDFGTTTSAAALVTAGGTTVLREPGGGDHRPSAVCLYGDQVLVGTSAENAGFADRTCYRDELKRLLGTGSPILLGDRSFDVVELVAVVLRVLRDQAEELHGAPVTRTVLTVPASYGPADMDPRTAQMIGAAESAGFGEVEVLAEPVAAALAPVVGSPFVAGDLVLAYDFGGGTFDAALIRFSDADPQILGHATLDDCGGRDIDALVDRHLRETGGAELTELLDPADDPNAALHARHLQNELRELVRRTKHQLTELATATSYFRPARQQFSVERDAFIALISSTIERTLGCCRDLVRDTGHTPDDVAAFLLAGGSSLMPAVSDALDRAFARPLRRTADPVLAVLHGAARWATASAGRTEPAWPLEVGELPVRWKLPGGSATVLRWLVRPGEYVEASQPLLVVRARDGGSVRLAGPGRPGTIARNHVAEGDLLCSGQPAATMCSPWMTQAYTSPAMPGVVSPGAWDENQVFPADDSVSALQFSPDSNTIAISAGDGTVGIYNVSKRLPVWQNKLDERRVGAVAFTPDGSRLATLSMGGLCRCWTADGEVVSEFRLEDRLGSWALDVNPSGRWIAVCGPGQVEVRDLLSGDRVMRRTDIARPHSCAFSSDGRSLVVADVDTGAHLLDVATGADIIAPRRIELWVSSVSRDFPDQGGFLLNAGSGISICTSDLAVTSEIVNFEGDSRRVVAHPDGQHIVSFGYGIKVFDRGTGRLRARFDQPNTSLWIADLSPDGQYVLVAAGIYGIRQVELQLDKASIADWGADG